MKMSPLPWMALALLAGTTAAAQALQPSAFERVLYNHPGLVADLGVGLWAQPLPMDFDGDGDTDLLVATADVPYNGTYFFENTAGDAKYPVFKPGVRIDRGLRNMQVSYVKGVPHVLTPGRIYPLFTKTGLEGAKPVPYKPTFHTGRANQWTLCDYDGDGATDLVIGASDWRAYGWDNAFDANGEWTRGPLHGYVYFVKNLGSSGQPRYAKAVQVKAGDHAIDVYGMPSPCLADFDGDGDLDIICGEFLDKLAYFQNVGTRTKPRYARGRFLEHNGTIIRMDLQMIKPVALDWDKDGDVDLVVGQEDGRVALVENTGKPVNGMPAFLPPRFFRQQAHEVKIGALATPYSFDWDGDGDDDLIVGDTAGYLSFVENLDGGNPPKWAAPKWLQADGKTIRIQAGLNGSIQGPAEAKWGYTVPCVADWDHDGLPDIVVNSIWGKVLWFRNVGTRTQPRLAAAQPIEVEWPGKPPKPAWTWWEPKGKQLATQWRTSPVVIDLNGDKLHDLVMLDHEGYLAFFERRKLGDRLLLLPPERIFRWHDGKPLRLNSGKAGRSGRRKLAIVDWDHDGRLDILANSRSIDFLRNVGTEGQFVFRNMGPVDPRRLAGHSTCPCVVDWDRDGRPDLLVGAEDGFLYHLTNPFPRQPKPVATPEDGTQPKAPPKPGAPAAHLVAAWDFEPGRGGPLADKATAGTAKDTLTPLGAATAANGLGIVPMARGSAFEAKSSPDLERDGELTIWVRLRVLRNPISFISLVDKRRFLAPEARSYALYIPPDRDTPTTYAVGGQISATGTQKGSIAFFNAKEAIPVGQWREVAMIVQRTPQFLAMRWLASTTPGPKSGAEFVPLSGPVGHLAIQAIFQAKQRLLIGDDDNLNPNSSPLEIDEVRLYDRALSPAELAAIVPGELSAR